MEALSFVESWRGQFLIAKGLHSGSCSIVALTSLFDGFITSLEADDERDVTLICHVTFKCPINADEIIKVSCYSARITEEPSEV